MKFTVVVPLYNKENHISRAIESVLNQTYKEFELIIVDDGSTDRGVARVKQYNDSRIRLIEQTNSGVSSARNRGISLANYDYIAFLDADDVWKPDFLETIMILIEKYPQAGAYATAYEFNNGSEIILPKSIVNIPENWQGIIEDYFKFSLKAPLISASSVVIPKTTFERVGLFPIGIKRGEDLDMWCRIALNYDIAFSNKICAIYFQDADNRACNEKAILADSICNHAEDILQMGRKSKNYSPYFEEYMIKMLIKKARYYIDENRKKEARKILYKYSYTKYNKKTIIKTYIISWLPKFMINMLYKIRKKVLE